MRLDCCLGRAGLQLTEEGFRSKVLIYSLFAIHSLVVDTDELSTSAYQVRRSLGHARGTEEKYVPKGSGYD